jgi:hypothetical protein
VTAALLLIDLMRRIVAHPLEPYSGSEVVDRYRALAAACRAKGMPVIAVRTERANVDEQPPGSDLVEALLEHVDEVVIKHTVGAFYRTGLDKLLHRSGADTVVLAGLVTTMRVESTARAAGAHGYDVTRRRAQIPAGRFLPPLEPRRRQARREGGGDGCGRVCREIPQNPNFDPSMVAALLGGATEAALL